MSTSVLEPSVSPEQKPASPNRFLESLANGQPIRAELCGLEQLELHAKALAASSPVAPGKKAGHPLLARFSENGRRLVKAHAQIVEATARQEGLAPDAEWLLDNFHIVLDTLREVRHDLPHGYYRELPKLAAGPLAGLPRVYAVAVELIAHTDSTLDEGNITRFVRAFQTVAPLTIGELWAVPIMLRLGLIENLRRLAEQMLEAWEHRRQAESCCGQLVQIQRQGRPAERHAPLAAFLRTQPTSSAPFVVRLLQALRDVGHEATGLIAWLETHFTASGAPPTEMLRREQQRQAANQVSVGNCVTSLRLLSALDWSTLFERMSLVEAALRDDPAGVYARQDFATKDRSRKAVEQLARGSGLDELTVARRALELARREVAVSGAPAGAAAAEAVHAGAGTIDPSALQRRHVGYYLIAAGRKELAASIRARPSFKEWLLDAILTHANPVYFGALGMVFAALVIAVALSFRATPWGAAAALLIAALVPLSELTVGIIHHLITLVLPPRVLPKLDFKEGIAGDCTAFVVMPTMLLRSESAKVLAERLEVHYLSNPDAQLRFALLTDFADAPRETNPEDEGYLQAAFECIKTLNERYPLAGPARANGQADKDGRTQPRFFLFHRRRVWNPVQGCWMGWERKRGKLAEFNRLLRGDRNTSFAWTNADLSQLPFIRYVITLDADTELPRETAGRMIGTLHHPLNQPRYDPAEGRVVSGYGILQPRVTLSLVAAMRSRFARILTSSAGIDPYTTAVSDVYQDLFGIGSFTGKGIYHVDAFEAATGHAFPDNRILSHDLIEGNHARCGLVTDIELLDDFPSRYNAYARREHRWIRGDWQLLPWLGRKVPASAAQERERRRNPLPVLERWKVIDNLRRSLVPPTLLVLLILGWTLPGASFWLWTGVALLVLALPLVITFIDGVISLPRGGSLLLKVRELGNRLKATAGQVLLNLTFLTDQARNAVDAIVRTLVRLVITRRHLLEWETAATTERRLGSSFTDFCLTMWPAPVLAVLITVAVALVHPQALVVAGPIALLWFVSPAVAFWVSQPRRVVEIPFSADERKSLRRIARKTWSFFETFVREPDHWLPPDNFQEDPKGALAHRTSPTNIGLYLLSCLSAHDLGYLTLPGLVERLERTFETLERLERFHGHFYNWYDTQSLRPLQPTYVSTVDSGNLLGCLLALKQGLRDKIEEAIPEPGLVDGLRDTLSLAQEEFQALAPPPMPEPLDVFNRVAGAFQEISQHLDERLGDLAVREAWLQQMDQRAAQLHRDVERLAVALNEPPEDLQRWTQYLAEQIRDQRNELAALAPWLNLLRNEPGPLNMSAKENGAGQRWYNVWQCLLRVDSLAEMQAQIDEALSDLAKLEEMEGKAKPESAADSGRYAASTISQAVRASACAELLERCQRLADRAAAFAAAMEFRMLYNESRQIFSIGFNLALNRLDNAHYDLLASESCLTSFLAIARSEVPKRHWFHLARPLTRVAGGITLLSWGGTTFEYLMPRLLLRGYAGTLLQESWNTAVARQIDYGRQHRVPWGISESGFSALDVHLDYQYQSFGVPGLGLKRGLGQNLVIAPYATALALGIQPHEALENLERLQGQGVEGPYGFYEAIDYTRDRLVEKRRAAVVRSYMAHHQGMSLVAMANCLLQDIMVRRFHNEPIVRATELLLQERMPSSAPLQSVHGDEASPRPVDAFQPHAMSRRVTTADTPHPRTHLLSNRKYSVMVTNAGSGYSIWEDIDVTRWREDRTRDAFGQFCYVRDLRSGLLWSAGYQPVCRPADQYEAVFSTDKAEFRRFDGGIETHLEITVSAENAAEVRRITLTNHNTRPHELELTSYAEIVLGAHAADLAHPAFGKLFLETEFVSQRNALLCRKRPRSPEQKPIWAVHVLAVDGRALGTVQFETDRARFLGRGRTPANPVALERNVGLSGSTGPVLDPIFSLRRRLQLGPGASMAVAFSTAVAESREQALALADQYHDFHGVNRAFEMAWAHTQVELRHLRISAEHLHLYQRLAAHVIYAGQALRVPNAVANNRQGQPGLWKFGISGDKPIVVARVSEINELGLVRQLLEAHSYWHMKGLVVDLVLLNEHPASYSEELHEELMNMVRASEAHTLIDRPGGVFVRKAAQMSDEDRLLLQAAARVVLIGSRGSLAGQVDRFERTATLPDRLTPSERRADRERGRERALRPPADLLFPNGLGGFTSDGREYVITIERRAWGPMPSQLPGAAAPRGAPESLQLPPAPWINVIANPNCGFLISESGAGYTWAGNSQANRLTPWHNDPVSDTPGEVIYLRDDDTGEFWTPTPAPVPPEATTVVRHGQGYTYFDQQSHGLSQELLLFVPPDDPIKLCRLRIRNLGTRERRLSTIYYVEWVLGMVRDQAALNVVPSVDPETGAQLARNAFNTDFAQQIGFADVSLRPCTCTADRTEFLGRNGSVAAPAALGRVELSGKIEPTLDPCAAMMAPFVIGPGEDIEIVFFLGAAARQEDVRRLLRRYRDPLEVEKAFKEACRRWERTLTTVQVRTPNPALDLLLNRWLLYQVLSCRLWARSAFYQSGGAYGFRDQLQDVMALVHGAPQEERAQILRAAARQFVEGDVQHWWHPPSGRGTRTHFSDDLLWLPLVACHYVNTTGDTGILDEKAPFLKGPVLAPDQEEAYFAPAISEETATLYEHCLRALEHGMRFGSHGLPLMGTGDWNDGMNRVGAGGKGESVWNGWFLLTILKRFVPIAEARGDTEHAARYREQMERLRAAMEASAWDGRWYRRAYFDDGTPLGSEQNDECKIDSLPQSWAVISGAADPERARQAMAAVEEFLVKEADKMILLFTPPFDQGKLQPGYIKGYVPGIRENGGQYTHAASWVVQATTLLGHGQRAIELFDLINPILHAATPEDVQHYKVEPYVVVGDIYGHPPHVGRGGWTWYTGSAGWLYRVGLENILGFRREANRLYVDPCIASRWPKFEITYRFGSATYHVTVENPRSVERGVHSVAVDGKGVEGKSIELRDDGQKHEVRVILGN